MKEYRSASGERRLWFEDSEIERIMQDELQKSGMVPGLLNPVVDLETLLEVHLGVQARLICRTGCRLAGR